MLNNLPNYILDEICVMSWKYWSKYTEFQMSLMYASEKEWNLKVLFIAAYKLLQYLLNRIHFWVN